LDISENPATQLYHVKFGYVRSELAYVPTNRGGATNESAYAGGAKDAADVIMELRFQNLFKGGGLYQRLAVGSVAVVQPGASFMFAKDADGTLSATSASAVAAAVNGVPTADSSTLTIIAPLARAYNSAQNKAEFDAIVAYYGYTSFGQFVIDARATKELATKIAADLKAANLVK
jgi:hypothetical protein